MNETLKVDDALIRLAAMMRLVGQRLGAVVGSLRGDGSAEEAALARGTVDASITH